MVGPFYWQALFRRSVFATEHLSQVGVSSAVVRRDRIDLACVVPVPDREDTAVSARHGKRLDVVEDVVRAGITNITMDVGCDDDTEVMTTPPFIEAASLRLVFIGLTPSL